MLALVGAVCAGAAGAQQPGAAPLNVIDWLDTQPPEAQVTGSVRIIEPGVAVSGRVPDVSVRSLNSAAPKRVGLAPPNVTGLPDSLWSASDGAALARDIETMPDLRLPALQSLYYTLLLAEAQPPPAGAGTFVLARVVALFELGALDPAMALLEQAGPETSPAHFAHFVDMSLIAGSEGTACAILRARPALSPGKAFEVFCAARAGDWNTAALILGTGRALGLVEPAMSDALERFLDPDLFEGEPPLPIPRAPDALLFRLFEANGTPIPTRSWPVVYANADLSDTAGWKAQIEAAERLARSGAVADNRLLGLYSQRRPAASGGVWDRVAALQRFETALGTASPAAVSKTLPGAWRAMRDARLAVHFAALFAEPLSQLTLSGTTADIAFDVLLLSPEYESAARVFPSRALRRPDLAAIAGGTGPEGIAGNATGEAVLAAFRDAPPDPAIISRAQAGALGAALIDTLALTMEGADGDVARLTTGLATLRALGLEDVARRTALQVLLLGTTP